MRLRRVSARPMRLSSLSIRSDNNAMSVGTTPSRVSIEVKATFDAGYIFTDDRHLCLNRFQHLINQFVGDCLCVMASTITEKVNKAKARSVSACRVPICGCEYTTGYRPRDHGRNRAG